MPIPSEITGLIQRLNQELNEIQKESKLGLNLAKGSLEQYHDNLALIQLFAMLNNYLLFVEICQRRIAYEQVILSSQRVTDEQIQNIGEDLSELLGQVLESKIAVDSVKKRLENWQ